MNACTLSSVYLGLWLSHTDQQGHEIFVATCAPGLLFILTSESHFVFDKREIHQRVWNALVLTPKSNGRCLFF